MKDCEWDEIQGFTGWFEFEKFTAWMDEKVKSGVAVEVEVKNRYSGSFMRDEKWFRHVRSGQVWRLVWPDPPAAGVFEPVENEEMPRRD